jgi:hypothetical protein
MKFAYVDTSCLLAIAYAERGAAALSRRLAGFDDLLSANLLEAELRAAFRRDGIGGEPDLLAAVSWVIPDRSLGPEIQRVLDAGYARGADCWHLAVALYLAGDPATISFLTLDERQRTVADALGFRN